MDYKRCKLLDLVIDAVRNLLFGRRPEIAVGDLVVLQSPYSDMDELCRVTSISPYMAAVLSEGHSKDEIRFERRDVIRYWITP